jgi:hypothetical protein
MSPTLRALLTGLIDYAGLFPPAKLPLDQAIRNYAGYRQSADNWMLGRFIIPAARLQELAAFDSLLRQSPPFAFSVLGRGGSGEADFLHSLVEDLTTTVTFCESFASWVKVGSLEVTLPGTMCRADSYEALCSLLLRAAERIESDGPPGMSVFYEMPVGANWRAAMEAVHAALQHVTRAARARPDAASQPCRIAGFKARCGGLEAKAFPSTEQLAAVITSCAQHAIAFKATAGLHHPFRHYSGDVQTHMHGFLNVFGAAALVFSNNLEEEVVRELLEDENPQNFVFGNTHFGWRHYRASIGDVEASRLQLATSFGSCSFDEPREDLQALELA